MLFNDVTERREAEERLRDSEARLAEERTRLAVLVDNLPVGVCFLDPNGQALLSNPAFRRLLPEASMPSRAASAEGQWFAWDEGGERLPRDRYPGARALRGEVAPGTEFLHRPGNGQDIWARVSGVPILSAGGQVAVALVVIVDITGQKRAQEALRRLNETLEAQVAARTAERDRLWQVSRDLFVIVGADGRYKRVNPAWTAALGYPEAELVGAASMTSSTQMTARPSKQSTDG